MHFKLIVAFVDVDKTNQTLSAARKKGAQGSTIISQARGEGVNEVKTFLGLSVETHTDVLLLLVEEHLSREILETIAEVAEFDIKHHEGIAFQIDVEDAIGVSHQIKALNRAVKQKI